MPESSPTAGGRQPSGAAGRPSAFDPDSVNRGTWRRSETVDQYRRLRGWTDPGEERAVAFDASPLSAGTYAIKVVSETGTYNSKFVKL